MNDEAAALLARNRRRRRIRFWVAVGTLPLTLAAFGLAVKLLSMYPFAHQAIVSHVVGDHTGTVRAAQGQEVLNIVERYKAPFNVGVGLASSGDLEGGRAKFEEALPLAEGLAVCQVRVNLSLVIERMGDAAARGGDTAGAMAFYAEALLITLETPDECHSPEADEASSDPDRSMGDTLDELEDRLREKHQSGPPPGQPEPEEPEEDSSTPLPSQEQLEELERRLEQGAEERQQHQQGNDEEGTGSGTDRPW